MPVLFPVCHIFDTLGLVVVICLGIAVAKLVVELAKIQGWVFEHPGEVFCLLHLFEPFVRPMIRPKDLFYQFRLFKPPGKRAYRDFVIEALSYPCALKLLI